MTLHRALGPRENENASSARPAKDPRALPALTALGTNVAEALPRCPLHETFRVADAPVVRSLPPGQLTGLDEKDPSALPVVMWTEGSLAVHLDNRVRTLEGRLPPPEDVSGGDSAILTENEQVIEPGAGPEKWRCLGTAEAGVTATNCPATASSTAIAGAQARRVEITFVGAAGRSLITDHLPVRPRAPGRHWSCPSRGDTPCRGC